MTTLKDYESEDSPGFYGCPNELHWDSAEDMLLCSDSFIGFCGCGLWTDFDYILGGLELIDDMRADQDVPFDEWYPKIVARRLAHFGSEAAAQFFFKWLDTKGYAEHGGSVPGWLTDGGLELLGLMREAKAMREEEE